jgi:hypothetical protein
MDNKEQTTWKSSTAATLVAKRPLAALKDSAAVRLGSTARDPSAAESKNRK